MSDRPQNYGPVLLIELIAHINEDKPPVLLLQVLLPHKPHHVDPTLYLLFHTPEELLFPLGLFGLHSHHRKDVLCKEDLPDIANPNRSHTGIIFCHYQAEFLQGQIWWTGRTGFCKTIHYWREKLPEFYTGLSVSHKLVLEADHVRPSSYPPYWYPPDHFRHLVRRDVQWNNHWWCNLVSAADGLISWAHLQMIWLQDLHHLLSHIRSDVPGMVNSAPISIHDPPNRSPELPTKVDAGVGPTY